MKALLLAGLLFFVEVAVAQKNDYNWLQGYGSSAPDDSATLGYRLGNTLMNFNYSPVSVSYDSLNMNFDNDIAVFSDNEGNLLFYSNAIYVANPLGEMIENSDSLNAGYVQYYWDPTIQQYGYRSPQGILALQSLDNANQYYLLYSFSDSAPGTGGGEIYSTQILSALVDMSANGGLGKAIFKNLQVIDAIIGQEVIATRHGNGRDWWILVQKRNSNCFYRILLDTAGLHLMSDLSCLGDSISDQDIGAACFSPDGSKYVYLSYYTGISIFDFDRCSGELSNVKNLPLPVIADSGWLGLGVAISPNNRFLYVSLTKQLYQLDLSDSDIFNTIDTIGIYDGFRDPIGSYFDMEQIGPDGKIYISCGNSEEDYHVINSPDSLGASCNFAQHSLQLAALSVGLPTFPNYRLGALTGSACDTLSAATEDVRAAKEQILKVFPNPAADYTIIDYGYLDWNKGAASLVITNALGQTVYQQQLPMYSGYQKIDISIFATGMYMAFIKRGSGVVAVARFVKGSP